MTTLFKLAQSILNRRVALAHPLVMEGGAGGSCRLHYAEPCSLDLT